MQLTEKETSLLKDLEDSEKLCIEKYTKHSAAAHDAQLKNLFSTLASDEQKHLEFPETCMKAFGADILDNPPPSFAELDSLPQVQTKVVDLDGIDGAVKELF